MKNNELIIKPKKYKGEDGYKVFSIRIKEKTVTKLDIMAKDTNRSRNELIGILLEYAIVHCSISDK